MTRLLSYEEKDTWVHRLSGLTKLIFFILWTVTSMLTYDTRILIIMIIISLVVFKMSKTEWKQVAAVFKVILVFLVLNLLFVFLLSPNQGCDIYGTRTELIHIFWRYTVTAEQLFYEFNMLLKYFTVVPAVFMFLVTTDPSEFASSLSKVGIHYNIGYALAIALRYIPDVQDDFREIRNAQEARGIEMSSKASLGSRIKNTASIIFPLIFSSMDRIDVVSNAMELRGFGKNKKRTWYAARPLKRNDYLVLVFVIAFCVAALIITYWDGSRFFNPFV